MGATPNTLQALACILAFSVLGYVTVSLVLLLIKGYGATNAEVVKSVRKVSGLSHKSFRML